MITLSAKPFKYLIYAAGLDKNTLFLKLRKHHPAIYAQAFLAKFKQRGNIPPVPEDLRKILERDYNEARKYVEKL